ncbi:hypothetical protein [Mammaliicoccus lentus]|jgi:septation ring formation regulator EzrA|uniref:DNA-binding protein n=1 Tax=Mammaliicoccus lentus TaxID=42858 RepID=A0AAX3W5L4_MAMLE|nr:hypothetical protein [Mammaliicoccus lentus]WHI60055.1 hypothetical protein PYH69_15480 [Mammaliicoccus lentus]
MEFIGFADVNEFKRISGISVNDLERKVFANEGFQEKCMYRFGKGSKRYIKIQPAIEYIEEHIMTKETDL